MPASTLPTKHVASAPEVVVRVPWRGQAVLNNPRLNKGTAFAEPERQALGLEGLLPPGVTTLQMQAQRNYASIMAKPDPLERYIGLVALQDRNEDGHFAGRTPEGDDPWANRR